VGYEYYYFPPSVRLRYNLKTTHTDPFGTRHKYIIWAVNWRSDRIREVQMERKDNIHLMEDRVVIDQQQNES
jgi:hypothetical protein